jgi:hypothetical protein
MMIHPNAMAMVMARLLADEEDWRSTLTGFMGSVTRMLEREERQKQPQHSIKGPRKP